MYLVAESPYCQMDPIPAIDLDHESIPDLLIDS
jgi:hypothetical protein